MDAVTTAAVTDIGRAARWALLLGTLFGLTVMHTLGHAGMQMGERPHAGAGAGSAATMTPTGIVHSANAPTAAAVVAECAGDHCGGPTNDGRMIHWSVCLAVLSSLAAIVAQAALLLGMAHLRTPVSGPRWGLAASRSPPRRLAGLTVASMAVLRT